MAWWYSMSLLQQVFFCIAAPATVVLIIQSILLFVGLGGDADADVDVDGSDADGGVGSYLIRGMVAFLTIGGWVGVGVGATELHPAWVIVIAVAAGAAAFAGIAFLIKGILKMQGQGNIEPSNSVGKIAKVYLPVPADGKGIGKVNVTVQDRLVELDAMTQGADRLETDSLVRIVGMVDENTVLVEAATEAPARADRPDGAADGDTPAEEGGETAAE